MPRETKIMVPLHRRVTFDLKNKKVRHRVAMRQRSNLSKGIASRKFPTASTCCSYRSTVQVKRGHSLRPEQLHGSFVLATRGHSLRPEHEGSELKCHATRAIGYVFTIFTRPGLSKSCVRKCGKRSDKTSLIRFVSILQLASRCRELIGGLG